MVAVLESRSNVEIIPSLSSPTELSSHIIMFSTTFDFGRELTIKSNELVVLIHFVALF